MRPEKAGHKVENKNKILSEVSDLIAKISKESDQATRYELAVNNFTQAAIELVNAWQAIDHDLEPKITHNETYPFDMSFDEKVYEIACWNGDIKEKISKWRQTI
jgi:hypothetical protein